jgi:hypothetical protein
MYNLLWKAVKCDTISNAGAYAPKMAGVARAQTLCNAVQLRATPVQHIERLGLATNSFIDACSM